MQILRGESISVWLAAISLFFCKAFSFVYCTSIFAFWEKVVDYSVKVWYTNGRRKTRHGVNRLVTLRYEFAIITARFLGWEFDLTTSLTIYGFGLRGNSAYKSIGKHRFRTKKHQKVNKSSQKTMAYLFGSKRPWVRIPSLRPHENNPNILLLGEAFGLFVLFEYPNFNSKKWK